jgi:hypothetical protein
MEDRTLKYFMLAGAIVIFACGALGSCAPAEASDSSRGNNQVVRSYFDDEAGVVCWTYYTNGISCLPISETKLER